MYKTIFILSMFFLTCKCYSADDCSYNQPINYVSGCYEQLEKKYDSELNYIYIELKNKIKSIPYSKSIKDDYWLSIVKSQRGWIVMRDNQCKVKGFFVDEKSATWHIEINNCLVNTTKQRIEYLKNEIIYLDNLP